MNRNTNLDGGLNLSIDGLNLKDLLSGFVFQKKKKNLFQESNLGRIKNSYTELL